MVERKACLTVILAASLLMVLISAAQAADGKAASRPALPPVTPAFSRDLIAPIDLTSDAHLSAERNGVKLDVYFNKGVKTNVAIYAINTGRPQLVLTPAHHRAILEDLLARKFTVVVADFRAKKLAGLELEKYVVQLTADAREAADGVVRRPGRREANPASKTDTFADDYFTLMPGFTVERDVIWFRYGDIPEAFRREIARQCDKPFNAADADKTNTYDIIYPVYGPAVGVLTNYASDEKSREHYFAMEQRYLVQAFALKNLAIVHQQYFNDPAAGYPKGYGYYGDQFAVAFIRHLKANAARYHIDTQKVCCFGHSKGSEVPGMLVNRLRATPEYLHKKVDFKKLTLAEQDKLIRSPHGNLSAEITCAILGAGVANNEMASEKTMPWLADPAKNISPFFVFADHVELIRTRTRVLVAKAKEHGVMVESAELNSHTWPHGEAYDRASAFADRMLKLEN